MLLYPTPNPETGGLPFVGWPLDQMMYLADVFELLN